jgi:STE24 endopeptidase
MLFDEDEMKRLLALLVLAALVVLTGPTAFAAPRIPGQLQVLASSIAAAPQQNPAPALETGPAAGNVTHYTLPPALYRKAHRLGQISFWGALVGTLYSWLILLLVLNWRLAPKYRSWAERASRLRFFQALIFAPLLLLTIGLLTIPLDVAQHSVSRRFGISIQGWASWAWDWTKQEIVLLILGTFLIWILYEVIRRSVRRWWFYFWLISLPLMALLVFVQPVVVDPLFHRFEPLAQKDPRLTVKLQELVHRAGQNIPPSRMYWMDAGAKTTALNAYVTGIGASKRIVVWDTTIRAMDTPQIVFVVGHEMGHYVLNHIWKGMAAGAVGLFVLDYLLFRTIGWLLTNWGEPGSDRNAPELPHGPLRAPGTAPLRNLKLCPNWEIRGVDDWASLPALLLLISVFSFIATPIGSAVSRHFEHQADQYGLEVTRGLTPDSGQVAAQSFEILGEVDLSDPAPNPVDVFLFYSHPPIPDRIRFALTYDPWGRGRRPK